MKYLLDTDHLSILQRQAGKDYSNLYSYNGFNVQRWMRELQQLRCSVD